MITKVNAGLFLWLAERGQIQSSGSTECVSNLDRRRRPRRGSKRERNRVLSQSLSPLTTKKGPLYGTLLGDQKGKIKNTSLHMITRLYGVPRVGSRRALQMSNYYQLDHFLHNL